MRKGIVFEIESGQATVMKNNGSFVSIPCQAGWQKGDVVTVNATTVTFKTFVAIAACFVLLVAVSAVGAGVYLDETALVSLDVNPSIELSVNRFDRVIAVRSLNDEGMDILEQVAVKNKRLDIAVSALFDGGLGEFVRQNPLVTFTVFTPDEQREQAMLDKLQGTADAYTTRHHINAQIELLSVDETMVNEAHHYNVTAGKYAVLQELQQVLPDMEMESYCCYSISYIREQTRMHGAGHGAGHGTPPSTEGDTAAPHGNKHRRMGKHGRHR